MAQATFAEQQSYRAQQEQDRIRANRATSLRAARRHYLRIVDALNSAPLFDPSGDFRLVHADVIEFLDARIKACDSAIAELS